MTNEQRGAIEYLKESVLIYKNTIPKISQSIEIVLSLIKEQERQMDLMAEYINEIDVSEDICEGQTMCDEDCEKCIKQYFERKVEDVKD